MTEEQLAERELRLKAQNKQKDVGLSVEEVEGIAAFKNHQKTMEHMAGDKPKQFTKNEKAKLKTRGIKPVVRIPTEHEEQAAVIAWADQHHIAKHLFAIPNGSHKSPAMAAKFKREGLRSGVPDLFLPVPSKGHHGLFIEMKRIKGSVTSEAQWAWSAYLMKNDYSWYCAKGADDAIKRITDYLGDITCT
jgi:hypothetical protein